MSSLLWKGRSLELPFDPLVLWPSAFGLGQESTILLLSSSSGGVHGAVGLFPFTATGVGEKGVPQTGSSTQAAGPSHVEFDATNTKGHELGKSAEPEGPEPCLSCGPSFPQTLLKGSEHPHKAGLDAWVG